MTSDRSEKRRHWRALHPEKRRAERKRYHANRRARERKEVFAHYGTSCSCCGTTERLTIDHVNGDGAEHRREMGNRGGYHTYHWLAVNGFPPCFQTMCEPCNVSKGRGGACMIDHNQNGTGTALYTPTGPLIAALGGDPCVMIPSPCELSQAC